MANHERGKGNVGVSVGDDVVGMENINLGAGLEVRRKKRLE